MPPDIIDIIIKAAGAGFEWLKDSIDIVLKATPSFGGLSPLMVLSGFFLVLVMGWALMHDGEVI